MIRFLVGLMLVVAAAPASSEEFQQARYLMGTVARIHLFADSESAADSAFGAAFAQMTKVDNLMSNWKDDSEISRVNREAGHHPVTVGEDLFTVLQSSLSYSRLTAGAFDMTVGPVVRLWGFIGGQQQVPGTADIRRALQTVGYGGVILDNRLRTVSYSKSSMYVDLGGIAKGYAVDKAVDALKRRGISRALVDLGGNIYALEATPDGKPWEVEVLRPRKDGDAISVLRLKNQAVATSGDYEKFFVADGKRYSHIIDPRTGWPSQRCVSVTVVAKTAMEADAISTGVFVLGPDKGLDVLKAVKGASGLVITSEMEVVEWNLR